MSNPKKIIELFAGSAIFTRTAKKLSYKTFATDIVPGTDINIACNFLHLLPDQIVFQPDIIWASPPCTTYSHAAGNFHRNGIKPISKLAYLHDSILNYLIYFLTFYPDAKVFIENPVGLLRSMPFMHQFERATVTYCSYGANQLKPTDIFTNDLKTIFNPDGWLSRERCWNGNKNCHHAKVPRSHNISMNNPKLGKSITELSSIKDRSILPIELCYEILTYRK